jgi:integrase
VNWPAATEIRVSRGWDDVEGESAPKSSKGERTVPVSGTLRRYLLPHKMATGRAGDDFLFGRAAREPFTPTHIRKQALVAWAEAGLAPIGLLECRHTYVSLMHAAGCSLEEIGDFVGRSSTYTTERYRHLLDGQREQAAAKLDRFLGNAVSHV